MYLKSQGTSTDYENEGHLVVSNSNSFYISYYVSQQVITNLLKIIPLFSKGKLNISFNINDEKNGEDGKFYLTNININYESN